VALPLHWEARRRHAPALSNVFLCSNSLPETARILNPQARKTVEVELAVLQLCGIVLLFNVVNFFRVGFFESEEV